MKKKELLAISLLSILIFVSFSKVSVAVPPSYVGVKEGDEFIWTSSLNMVNLNASAIALFGEDNWTYMYNYFLEFFENNTGMEFDFLAGAGMKVVIQNVTDEMPHPYYPGMNASGIYIDYYIAYAANNWTLVAEAANFTNPMMFLIDPNTLNESTIMYGISGTPFIMPIGFNYSMFADVYQTMIESDPYLNGNITIQVQGNRFEVTLKAAFLAYMFDMMGAPFEIGTLSDAVMTFRWNNTGVFEYASLEYGGLTLVTAQLVTTENDDDDDDVDDLIPGYGLVTILGVSLATFIALVYTISKKKILK
jgi:hypothetical protein